MVNIQTKVMEEHKIKATFTQYGDVKQKRLSISEKKIYFARPNSINIHYTDMHIHINKYSSVSQDMQCTE